MQERMLDENQERLAALVAKRDELVERLDRGAAKIEAARAQGKNTTDWETFWMKMLKDYERICDEIVLFSPSTKAPA